MTRIWTGSASVENGETTIVLTGAPLTAANCPADATIVLAGATYFVAEAVYSTMTLELTRAYEGSDGTVSAEIDPMTPITASVVALAQSITTYDARLELLDAYGKGLFYTVLGVTGANDPGPGKVARSGATWDVTNQLYFDVLDAGGFLATPLIDRWASETILTIRSIATRGFVSFRILTAPADVGPGQWRLIASVQYLGGDGAVADGEDVAIEWNRVALGGVEPDATVDTPAGLTAYLGEAEGFRVLVADVGDGRSAIYSLDTSSSPATWIGPAYMTGPPGPSGPFVALSDEYTAISVGLNKMRVRVIRDQVWTGVRLMLSEASISGPVEVDIRKNGSSIFTVRPTIDQGELTSKTAAIPAVFASLAASDDDLLSFDITAAGSGAKGLKAVLISSSA